MSTDRETVLERSHPAANLFPLMGEQELRELADDIARHGQRDTIELREGLILDGRNRWLACAMVGVAPLTAEIAVVGSPTAYVISKNLHRRHLTTAQRAAVAAEALPMFEDEAKERQRLAGERYGRGEKPVAILPPPIPDPHKARDDAAAQFDVSPRYVQEAKRIKEKDEGVFKRVKAGEMSIPQAKREAGIAPPPPTRSNGTATVTVEDLVKGASKPPPPSWLKPETHTDAPRRGGIPEDVEYAAKVIQKHFDAAWIATLVKLLKPVPVPHLAGPLKPQHGPILDAFREHGPMTRHELAAVMGKDAQAISPRLGELRSRGALVTTGEKRPAPSGKQETVYALPNGSGGAFGCPPTGLCAACLLYGAGDAKA